MRVHFVLGPAGSGKTFRCLTEIRAALAAAPEGPPLVLLAPKQATFQLERQLLADPALPGYTRLQILAFERLAEFVLAALHRPPPKLLSEEGRVMVLRALLTRHQGRLKLFRASARLPGFAQQLSALLHEFHRHHLSPATLETLTAGFEAGSPLADKLHDFGLLLRAYADWLRAEDLQDADHLLDVATEALREVSAKATDTVRGVSRPGFQLAGLWLDGFAEMTPQELDLLAALAPVSNTTTLAFCLERPIGENEPPLSIWGMVGQTCHRCRQRLEAAPGVDIFVEVLPRLLERGRFAGNPVLQHLEACWANPRPFHEPGGEKHLLSPPLSFAGSGGEHVRRAGEEAPGLMVPMQAQTREQASLEPRETLTPALSHPMGEGGRRPGEGVFTAGEQLRKEQAAGAEEAAPSQDTLRVVACADPEAEAVFAAREILRFVREDGGRFRDTAVLLRSLDGYHDVLRRVFTRYQIPFFLDRREPVAHHPMAELTRNAVRVAAFGWRHDDWFGALKTGLAHRDDAEIDSLENEALAHGWEGDTWGRPLRLTGDEAASRRLERLRQKLVAPFQEFIARLEAHQGRPTGAQLAEALAGLWDALDVAGTLEDWSGQRSSERRFPRADAVHATVWQQMQDWLTNLALAFPGEPLPLIEWLPILEAGLAELTVGAIPPVLDQVLVGTIDRSRNPDLQMTLVLGVNESVFPAAPPADTLLTESDRDQLAGRNVVLGPVPRRLLGHERYYGYVACTRARRRVGITFSQRDADASPLNPSAFIARLQRLFPSLKVESAPARRPWVESEHASELVAPWLAGQLPEREAASWLGTLEAMPGLNELRERLARFSAGCGAQSLDGGLAGELYGPTLKTSVSRLEQFAACPFRFFVHSGLRAEERRRFELDAREQGSFQHEVLAEFHRQLRAERKEWRELTPREASGRIGRIGEALAPTFREGLLHAAAGSRFAARSLTRTLQDFIETTSGWMRQYGFDPRAVEVGFGGPNDPLPAWELELGGGHRLALQGKIDRVDLAPGRAPDEALCVVIDYKSSRQQLEPALLAGGVQLQLPAYLGGLRRLRDPRPVFGVARLVPAGVFYVNLRGQYTAGATRSDVLDNLETARQKACQHTGRFDLAFLRQLDRRPGAKTGNQFKYHLNNDNTPHQKDRDPMTSEAFAGFLDDVEAQLVRLGRAIFSGAVRVDPYRKDRQKACDHCDYASVCRIDPWTHVYRALASPTSATAEPE